MKNVKEHFIEFIKDVEPFCNHVSIREDENGPYIFALGLKETHTLQMRKVAKKYVLELWYGDNADVETVVEEPEYSDIDAAFARAKNWLEQDAI